MGFYLRKSISVGPIRFNLSKSGIGVSAGVKGLRLGAGARGNYVHMGRGGLYYRAAIPSSSPSPAPRQPTNPRESDIASGTHAPLKEIESADISQIADSSSQELLSELNQKRKITQLWPIVATGSALIFFFGVSNALPNWLLLLTLVIASTLTYMALSRDKLAKTVVLFYDFDTEMEDAYRQFHSVALDLSNCAAVWHIEAQGNVFEPKYHAGANSLVRRKKAFIRKAKPSYLESNIESIGIAVGRQVLVFFPDRVLIYGPNGIGAVGYHELRIDVKASRFIEDGVTPRDAKVVDHTWKYVNKSGGPDLRFKENRKLPICLYDEISLSSQTGFKAILQVSRCDIASSFAEAISALARKLPKEESSLAPAA
jgi:hypothetical protein